MKLCMTVLYYIILYTIISVSSSSGGSNPVGDEIFRPSRPGLEPSQPPLKWVPGLSQVQKETGACF